MDKEKRLKDLEESNRILDRIDILLDEVNRQLELIKMIKR